MNLGARLRAGDQQFLATTAEHAIGRNCKLESHIGQSPRLAREVGRKHTTPFVLKQSGFYDDAGFAQDAEAATGNARVRIVEANDDTGDTCRNQSISAGRCASVMGTGFERDIGSCPPRPLAGNCQRLRLGMGPAANGGNGLTDDRTVLDNDAADGRVGCRQTGMPSRQPQGCCHEAPVIGCARQAPSPDSSPGSRASLALISSITFSKSSAWEKSR
ncbi:hypothetical protein D3C73_488270 [compost metagenome]